MKDNKANRLINEHSPYLLQHAYNEVDWYPWGQEAFDIAKKKDKLLFISIGYSSCRWCHNMRRDTFEDKRVAQLLNDEFIAIKVDKEEKPDIDSLYMSFAHALNGNGGWPLTVVATSEGKPIYIGTYFPPDSKGRIPGLLDILPKLLDIYKSKRFALEEDVEKLYTRVLNHVRNVKEAEVKDKTYIKALSSIHNSFDEINGGFYGPNKFPMAQNLLYLLGDYTETKNKESLNAIELTLDKMAKGGIFDQIGFGFFRYTVENTWLIPHFEKMLYDNALMLIVYSKAYAILGKKEYKEMVRKLAEFIVGEMYDDENGGFYTSIDSETNGIEGEYYLFDQKEIIELLGEDWGSLFNKYYDITNEGNFESKNIPNLLQTNLDDFTKEDLTRLNSIAQMVLDYRKTRENPFKDTKKILSWNALAIVALSYAANILDSKYLLNVALDSLEKITKVSIEDLKAITLGEVSYEKPKLADMAFLLWAAVRAYKSTKEEKLLSYSEELANYIINNFQDENKALLYTKKAYTELSFTQYDIEDGSIPSGTSILVQSIFELSMLSQKEKYKEVAEEIVRAFGDNINSNPLAYLYTLIAIRYGI